MRRVKGRHEKPREQSKGMKLLIKIASFVFMTLLAIPIIILLYLVLSPDYMVLMVKSDSMKPTFNAGDVIVLRAYEGGDIDAGQIIAFDMNGNMVTHRAHSVESGVITTKGDAVQDVDKWEVQTSQVKGIYSLKIPYLGYVAKFCRSKSFALLAIAVAAILLMGLVVSLVLDAKGSHKGGDAEKEKSHELQWKRERERKETWV